MEIEADGEALSHFDRRTSFMFLTSRCFLLRIGVKG